MPEAFGAAELASFDSPDDIRTYDYGKAEVVTVGGAEIGRYTMEPGYRWTDDPSRDPWCEAPHFQYHIAGTLRFRLEDGTEFDVGPGTVLALPTPHVAWVVGDEPVVVIDWWGIVNFARPPSSADR
jgi:quercetin dioxygenase-like cupin family protein